MMTKFNNYFYEYQGWYKFEKLILNDIYGTLVFSWKKSVHIFINKNTFTNTL